MSDLQKQYEKAMEKAADRLEIGEKSLALLISRDMIQVEGGLRIAAEHLCQLSMDDRYGETAMQQSELEQALDMINAAHRIASRVAAQRGLLPIPMEGDR